MRKITWSFIAGLIFAMIIYQCAILPAYGLLWKTEVVERGGAAWIIDNDGKIHWEWKAKRK